ncbi:MAG: hypothetical protein A3D16_10810 [Rhodobacterales bacterium RIFCSPHIGHO2_02_FULL_62_130]|nr:MAG: hypothetical protein A3D16_10810 [Rhodobacterales bacterium RIFCSPHIGHO2_02_FULL_62_130]OHC56483.1 MAG: hypothetical protein A3E48_21735 [Rhodobacterales bacterium RIFCSPHIGHO2_12_FULL_62_75]
MIDFMVFPFVVAMVGPNGFPLSHGQNIGMMLALTTHDAAVRHCVQRIASRQEKKGHPKATL